MTVRRSVTLTLTEKQEAALDLAAEVEGQSLASFLVRAAAEKAAELSADAEWVARRDEWLDKETARLERMRRGVGS